VRILFVYPTLFTELAGGLEVRNLELAAALARRGHRVTLAARTSSDAATLPPGVDLARLGPFRTVYNASGRRSTSHQWLREGFADAVAVRVLDRLGALSADSWRRQRRELFGGSDRTQAPRLAQLATFTDWMRVTARE